VNAISLLRWIKPDGSTCTFEAPNAGDILDDDNDERNYCPGDSNIRFIGNFAQSSCDIQIEEADVNEHDGLWKCVATASKDFVDNVDIVVNTGLETSTILAFSIPLAVLLLLLIILLLVCLFCPAYLRACLNICRRKKPQEPKPQSMPMQPPPPQPYSYSPYESVEPLYEMSEGTSTIRPIPAGAAPAPLPQGRPRGPYEPMMYSNPRPSVPDPPGAGPRTAHKISNVTGTTLA